MHVRGAMASINSFIQFPPTSIPSPPTSDGAVVISASGDLSKRLSAPSSGGLIALGIICGLLFISVGVLLYLILMLGKRIHEAREDWDTDIFPRLERKKRCKTCSRRKVGKNCRKAGDAKLGTLRRDARSKEEFYETEKLLNPGRIRYPPTVAHAPHFREPRYAFKRSPSNISRDHHTSWSASVAQKVVEEESIRGPTGKTIEGEDDDAATDASQAGTSFHGSRAANSRFVYVPHMKARENKLRLEKKVAGQGRIVNEEWDLFR